ncbi:prostaglandin reductase 1-like [Diadema antillarum]|uniref:prostaglandin reductase 1-like n=1 Tax=Diadema antillarum TaxID=105358 RepID=UPI003A85F367
MSRKGKRWVLVKYFDGFPKESDVRLEEFNIPALQDGEVLVEAEFLTVDPYMRPYNRILAEGMVMTGEQVARVTKSRNDKFPVGTWVKGFLGWSTHTVNDGKRLNEMPTLPPNVPRSYALGTIGMPGLTAYVGFLDICTPKEGEIVLVSGAAGAVGSVVGQIAKIKGCRVIGSAGSDEKVKYLKEIGFDEAFNYKKTTDLDAKLKELAPDGIDIYFDNVGGEFATTAIMNMRKYGRISCCGSISTYNTDNPAKTAPIFGRMLFSELKMQGFMNSTYAGRFPEGLADLTKWVAEGKIKVREHVTEGFENMFTAFTELFTGANTGKAIIKV